MHGRSARWLLVGLLISALLAWWALAPPTPSRAATVGAPAATLPQRATDGRSAIVRNAAQPSAPTPMPMPMPVEDEALDPQWQRCEQELQIAVRARYEQLAARDDARSQLVASLLAPSVFFPRDLQREMTDDDFAAGESHARQAIAAAQRLDPLDPVIAWHAHAKCTPASSCDRDQAAAALARSDPGNPWTWIKVADAAHARGDKVGVEQALARAADADSPHSYVGETALLIVDRLGELPLTADCAGMLRRFGQVLGLDRDATSSDLASVHAGAIATAVLPLFGGVLNTCAPRRNPSGRDKAMCMALFKRLAEGDTLMEQSMALSHLVQYTAGQREGAQWRERYRNLKWLIEQANARQLSARGPMEELWVQGEVRGLQARLQRVGAWPAPPGWLPASRCERARVTSGRLPSGC